MKSTIRLTLILIVVPTYAFAEPSAPYHQEPTQVMTAGKIVGRVRGEGRYERPAPLKVYKNRDFCGATVPNESFIVNPEGGLRNAVIIVLGFRREKAERQIKNPILDNKNCAFVPHVQVAPVGSELLLLNSDPILHDVHARLGSETLFNVGLPTWRQVKKRLTRTGIVTIECDVLHTWMSAHIVVTSSPYFAVTDERGEFVIDRVPDGTYEIHVWHEKLGNQSKRVTVAGNRTPLVDFVYRLPRKDT
ncbi:MAG: hypothetical protein HYY45_01135 [Deltaproteobacteria bacterium]|nr:hypothetical protein [Deltaproteobacteria bacterium]